MHRPVLQPGTCVSAGKWEVNVFRYDWIDPLLITEQSDNERDVEGNKMFDEYQLLFYNNNGLTHSLHYALNVRN